MEREIPRIAELEHVTNSFVHELREAAAGRASSIPYIHSPVPNESVVRDGETFQVMVIGGTMYRQAIYRKEGNQLTVLGQEEFEQPTFATFEDFAAFFTQRTHLHSQTVSINLAYPLEPVAGSEVPDAVLISGSKGNIFEGLVGARVGQKLNEYTVANGGKALKIAVANDATCLVLAGLTGHPWDNLAGGIIGTGLNFSIFESRSVVINTETGSFTGFEKSPELQIVDKYSLLPGRSLLEKMITGAHLYRHFNLKSALINPNAHLIGSTEELDAIAKSDEGWRSDLARDIFKQSAQYAATQIAGLMRFQGKPLTFVMEGSLFWKSDNYPQRVTEAVSQLSPDFEPQFVEIKDSALKGGAKLVAQ